MCWKSLNLKRSNLVEKDGVLVNEELLKESIQIHWLQAWITCANNIRHSLIGR